MSTVLDAQIPLFKNPLQGTNIRYLILILTWRCNLSCGYCYNGSKPQLDMDKDILERAFELIDTSSQEPFHVQLTGGEPTLVPELLERAGELFNKLKSKRKGTLAVQTNATMLDSGILRLFKKYGVEVGLSLDGPPEQNELTRGGTRALLKGLELLNSREIPFNVTTVVSAKNAPKLPTLPLFLSNYPAARGLGLDLLVNKGAKEAPAEPEALHHAALKLRENLLLVNTLRPRGLVLRELELLKKAQKGESKHFCEAHCQRSLAVAPDGALYPCGQAAGDMDLSFGSLDEYKSPKKSLSNYFLTGPHCVDCPLQGKCPGECPSRLNLNPGSERLVCSLYRGLSGY